MATNRSRRLRKKLCVEEFQELGFELHLNYKEGMSADAAMAFFERFLVEAIEANGLGFVGVHDYGFVCLGKRGSVSDVQRSEVESWLQKGHDEVASFKLSPLMDVWYPETPVNA
ncbi:YggL family protein [Pseudomonas boanensis]|uniref:YggL 50S ribosome-binding family protein n=1 Tax=Metapseudomonas boanensis TaxID=2822138 RepID=UPI0035D4300A